VKRERAATAAWTSRGERLAAAAMFARSDLSVRQWRGMRQLTKGDAVPSYSVVSSGLKALAPAAVQRIDSRTSLSYAWVSLRASLTYDLHGYAERGGRHKVARNALHDMMISA
jgi:hypothetical protein